MRQKAGFKLRQLGDEHIITAEGAEHINFNKLLVLNASAAYLWQRISETDFDAQRLADLLKEEYGIDDAMAQRDANAILQQWLEAGLVEN